MIEAWGRGIERIMEACRAAGVAAPTLRYEHTGLWVEFAYRMPEKTREKTRGKTGEKILDLIAANPAITTEELADQIGISRKGIEWQISKLKRTGGTPDCPLGRLGRRKQYLQAERHQARFAG